MRPTTAADMAGDAVRFYLCEFIEENTYEEIMDAGRHIPDAGR